MKQKFIAIEGNIGVGKTSLAKLLNKKYGGELILENFRNNPFLKQFYENSELSAFPVEMHFLLDRYNQFLSIKNNELFVSDFFFFKTQIFAKNNLSKKEFELFQKYFKVLSISMPKPDVLIYLDSNETRLIKNIKKRGRVSEKNISKQYLSKLGSTYSAYLNNQKDIKVVRIDVSNIDFVLKRSDFNIIIKEIGDYFLQP